jgi:hypothetical protein
MSDSNQFGTTGTAVVDPPADEEIGGSVRSKRGLLVAVAVGAVVLAAAAYFLLFSGGSGSDDASTGGVVPHASTSAGGASAAPSATAQPVNSASTKHVSSSGWRDPFAPLVVPSAQSSGAGSGTGTSTGGGSSTSSATVPSGLTEVVTLSKVATSPASVDVTVNGKKYTAQTVGQVFGTYFSLAVVTGSSSATLNFGDSSFALSVGKSVTLHT